MQEPIDKLSDQVFDSMVEELVTGRHPPDLVGRIRAACELEAAKQHSVATVSVAKKRLGADSRSFRKLVVSVSAIAASFFIGIVLWRSTVCHPTGPVGNEIATQDLAKQEQRSKEASATNAIAGSTLSRESDSVGSTEDQGLAKSPSPPPFELDRDLASHTASGSGSAAQTTAIAMTSDEVVKELDRHLDQLWQVAGVQNLETISNPQLAQRISFSLTGQQLSESVLKDLVNTKRKQFDKSTLIVSATETMSFYRRWSHRLTSLWLGHSPKSPGELALVESLARQIQSGRSWNDVVQEMIGGDLAETSSLSNQFLSLLASGNNRKLIECIGENFLNQQVACSRCHDPHDKTDTQEVLSQASYWALLATFKGIEGHGPDNLVSDRQRDIFSTGNREKRESGVYFELPSGAMQQAFAAMPDGTEWSDQLGDKSVPRAALANWIAQSGALERATVNSVWKILFGQSLLPSDAAELMHDYPISPRIIEHRRAMSDLLSVQFRMSGGDLKKLVGWIVGSRAFAIDSFELTQERWQSLSDQELNQLKIAQACFAWGPQAEAALSTTFRENIQYVAKWRSNYKPNSMLAQRAIQKGTIASQPEEKTMGFNPSFALNGLSPAIHEERYVDRLLGNSRLNWEQRVEHIVLRQSQSLPTEEIQRLSKQLLESHMGDAKSALLDLFWAARTN